MVWLIAGGAGGEVWGRLDDAAARELRRRVALTDSLPLFSRARGEPRRHRNWSGRWRAAPADFFFGFRRRLELRGRPRRQPDRALAGFRVN